MRKTISIDFDGVLHLDGDDWIAPAIVTGRANVEAFRFIQAALELGWDVVVHSCRFYDLGAVAAVREWITTEVWDALGEHAARFIGARLQYSLTKPRAKIYIDDRGFRYQGKFPTLQDIEHGSVR